MCVGFKKNNLLFLLYTTPSPRPSYKKWGLDVGLELFSISRIRSFLSITLLQVELELFSISKA